MQVFLVKEHKQYALQIVVCGYETTYKKENKEENGVGKSILLRKKSSQGNGEKWLVLQISEKTLLVTEAYG